MLGRPPVKWNGRVDEHWGVSCQVRNDSGSDFIMQQWWCITHSHTYKHSECADGGRGAECAGGRESSACVRLLPA